MSQIIVPIINENPDSEVITFETEYAVSFDAANPDGNPAHCKTGGPGILGGPDCVTLLQRTPSADLQHGYREMSFELGAHPLYTFHSFYNADTGAKNIVAMTKTGLAVPSDISPTITAPAYATVGATGLAASATVLPGTYAWTLDGTSTTSAITSAATANPLVWSAGVVGNATFHCVFTNVAGIAAPAATPVTCVVVAAVTAVGVITATASVQTGTAPLTASVVAQAGCTYAWTCSDGTITSGQGTNAITYTAGAIGTNNINCAVSNLAGHTLSATQKVVTVTA